MVESQTRDQFSQPDFQECQLILPLYIVCDTSGAMTGALPALRQNLASLVEDLASDPVIADTTMLSIITFDNVARTLVPLSDPDSVKVPEMNASGGASYSQAFEEYNRGFTRDYRCLQQANCRVFRPHVFFLTSGQANDIWEDTFQRLIAWDPVTKTGNKMYPYIMAFGFGGASEGELKKTVYPNFGEKLGRWVLYQTNEVDEILSSVFDTIRKVGLAPAHGMPSGQYQFLLTPPELTVNAITGEAEVLL